MYPENMSEIIDITNRTEKQYDKYSTLVSQFGQMVRKYPERIAVICEEKELTYRELDRIAEQIAVQLGRQSYPPQSMIGIFMEKTEIYIASVLGILKCGHTYLPFDSLYPAARIKSVIEKSKMACVLVHNPEAETLQLFQSTKVLYVDKPDVQCLKEKGYKQQRIRYDDIAYVIFTSGSTGEPKGIKIKHHSVTNLIVALDEQIHQFGDYGNIGLLSPMVFDLSVGQLFLALLTGKTLVILSDERKKIPELLLEDFRTYQIQVCDITPQHLYLLIRYIRQNEGNYRLPEVLFCAGEALPLPIVHEFFQLDHTGKSVIINSYGPAEACVYVSQYIMTEDSVKDLSQVYIGKPVQNTRIYIFDEYNKLCDVGGIGELCIAGDGVSTGYLNAEDLTKEKFVPNPVRENEIIYKTGDLAEWSADGNINYIGRMDNQVKIRGFRIELDEISNCLSSMEEIDSARVIVDKSTGNDLLIAYIVKKVNVDLTQINQFIEKHLPYYMIPNYFVELSEFPTTINGKIDVKRLPDYQKDHMRANSGGTKEEGILAKVLEICSAVIGIDGLEADINYFQAGGNSLLLLDLTLRMEEEWGVKISLAEIYKCNTIREIASLVNQTANMPQSAVPVMPEEETKLIKATDFQKVIFQSEAQANWKRDQFYDHTYPTYNLIFFIRMNRYVEGIKFENALKQTVKRHMALRTVFIKENNEHFMHTLEEVFDYFQIISLQGELSINKVKCYARDFVISEPPLMQIILFENEKREQVILFNIHHGVFDYLSVGLLLEDVFKNYQGIACKLVRFDSLASAYRTITKERAVEEDRFWNHYFKERPKCSYIPPENDMENIRIRKTDLFADEDCELRGDPLQKVSNLCKKLHITEYVFYISVLAILLGKKNETEDVVIGTYVPGRTKKNAYIIGFFSHMTGIRMRLLKAQTVKDFLKAQHKNIGLVLEHPFYEHTDIYRALDHNDFIKGELFSVIFNYIFQYNLAIGDYLVTADDISEESQKLPVGIKIFATPSRLLIRTRYAKRLYSGKYVKEVLKEYLLLINYVLENVDKEYVIGQLMGEGMEIENEIQTN